MAAIQQQKPLVVCPFKVGPRCHERLVRTERGHRVAAIELPSSTRIRRIASVFRTARPRHTYLAEARRFRPSTRNVL